MFTQKKSQFCPELFYVVPMSRTYIYKQIPSTLLGLFIAMILYAEPSFASHENIPLTETFNIYNGLSDDTVNDVLSDSRGFIWVATYKGLDRYDGYHIKHISLNDPRSLCEDAHGNIWAGTPEGIYRYDTLQDRIEQIEISAEIHGVQFFRVCAVDDQILVQCGKEFCAQVDSRTLKVIKMFPAVSSTVSETGSIYYMSSDGYVMEFIDGMPAAQIVCDKKIDECANLFKMCCAGRYLFLCMEANLFYVVDLVAKEIVWRRELRVYDVLMRRNSQVWIASLEGVYIVDADLNEIDWYPSGYKSRFSLPESLRALEEDYQGGIWAATYYSGLIHMVDNPADVKVYEPEIADAHFWPRTIVEDPDGFLWVTSTGSGLYKLYPDRGKLEKVSFLESTELDEYVASIAVFGSELWLGNKYLTCKVNRQTGRVSRLEPDMGGSRAFLADPDGTLWVSFTKGVYKSDDGMDFQEVSPHSYSSIAKDSMGRIWATSFFFGIMKYTQETGSKYYNVASGNSCSYKVSSIVQDDLGRIWAGTYGDGLLVYSEKDDVFVRSDVLGSFSLPIFKILKDEDGHLWITTSRALILFDPETGRNVRYTANDGLPKSSFNYSAGLLASDGNIYAGVRDRLISFSPSLKKVKPSEIRMCVTDFRMLGTEDDRYANEAVMNAEGQLELPYGCNSFEFKVTDMNYTLPGNSYIYYRLEGFSDKWLPVEDGKLSFINLPIGKYRLTIRSKDAFGEFYPSEATVAFRVRPPFMFSLFMLVVYVCLLVATIYIIVTYYRRKALKDAQAKAMMDSLIRESENEKQLYASKVEFITNIAHEIKTPLSLIKLPAESLSRRFRNIADKSVVEDVDIIHKNSEKLNQLLGELLNIREFDSVSYELNPQQCNVIDILHGVFQRFEVYARKSGVRFSADVPDEALNTSLDRMHFDKILSNLFSNALKYADTYAKVRVTGAGSHFTVVVENDGDVVPADMREKIFHPLVRYVKGNLNVPGTGLGLSISRKLATLMGGNLYMDEDVSVNRFILTLPMIYLAPQVSVSESVADKRELELLTEKKTLLVVEDNEDMAGYIARKFRGEYNVVSASDGVEALQYLEKGKLPSFVVTDLMMPNMDGFTLCKEIKKTKRTANIPVVVVSAIPEDEARIQSLEFGADAYLEKPFAFELLETTLKGLLENRERIYTHYSAYPIVSTEQGISGADEKLLLRIQDYILEHLSDTSLRVEDLAQVACMSKSNLLKKMKSIVTMSPGEFVLEIRLKKAKELLADKTLSISLISSETGFSSPSYFTQAFTRRYGISPKQFRENPKNA